MKRIIPAVITTAALLIAGCTSDIATPVQTSENNPATEAKGGTLRLSMANDAAENIGETLGKIAGNGNGGHVAGTIEHIWITIKEVQIHTSGHSEQSGWNTVATPGAKFDFLELVDGVTSPLDLYALPAGHYTQIRLFLESETGENETDPPNAIVIDGETYPLTIPSAFKSGIKCVRAFFIEEGETTEICLRFSAFKDIHFAPGNGYMMHPAFRTYKCDGSDDEVIEDDENSDDEVIEEDDDYDPEDDIIYPDEY